MDYFKFLIKRILYKIPLKLLLLIAIVLFLSFICLGNNVFAATLPTNEEIEHAYNVALDYHINTLGLPVPNYYVIDTTTFTYGATIITFSDTQQVYANKSGNVDSYRVFGSFCQYAINTANPNNVSVWYNKWSNNTYTDCSRYNTLYNNFVINNVGGGVFKQINEFDFSTKPYIIDTSSISNWSFDNLVINSGDIKPYYSVVEDNIEYQYFRTFKLETTYEGVVYTTDLRQYATAYNNDYVVFNIPKNELSNYFNIYNGYNIQFDLYVQPDDNPNSTGNWSSYSLGTYTFNLTTEEQEQINSDSNKQLLGNIDNSIQQTNNNINQLNNTQQQTNDNLNTLNNNLTSSDYNETELTNSFSGFGEGMILTDNTHLEQLFVILYNAFCNNTIVDLTFTIPFVNQQVTINSSNISAHYPQQLVTIVHLFVWGMIGLYIIKDIRTMINKVAEGNVENVSSDVKKEVL